MVFDWFKPVTDFFSAAAPYVETGAKYAGAAAAVAGVASAALPLFMGQDDISAPQYQAPTAAAMQADAAAEATRKRREILRRRGQASTVRTPLGVRQDIGVRRAGIMGV